MNIGSLGPAPERPAYTAAEAARYARTSQATARRWLLGYDYRTLSGRRHSGPVTSHQVGERYLTFYDLVEVAAIAAAKNAGVTLPRIRSAIDYAQERFNADRPLLLERFLTDGRDLFLRELHDAEPMHVNASQAGQLAFPYIAEVLRHLTYESERPIQWWPVGQERSILVDPRVGFGQPLIYPSGIRTETVVDRWLSDEPIEAIAEEFGLTTELVEDALRFENKLGLIPA
jgi:uncharacterized protein (DUF433 family)/DNA-binding transcriptional MerR regulator